MTDVNNWTEDQVVNWVSSLGADFAEFAPLFKTNNINGRRLLKFNDDKLIKLGINSLGVRDDLVEEIGNLQKLQDTLDSKNKDAPKTTIDAPKTTADAPKTTAAAPVSLLANVEEKGQHLLAVLQGKSNDEIVSTVTTLVKVVREVLDTEGGSAETRSTIVNDLGQIVAQTKQVSSGPLASQKSAQTQLIGPVERLLVAVRAFLTNSPVPPSTTPSPAPSRINALAAAVLATPSPPPKPSLSTNLTAPTAAPRSPFDTGAGPRSAFAQPAAPSATPKTIVAPPKPVKPPPFQSAAPSPPKLLPKGSNMNALAAMVNAPSAPPAVATTTPANNTSFDSLIINIYSGITLVSQHLKNEVSSQIVVDSVGVMVGNIVKLLHETNSNGRALVDVYDLREALVAHSTNAGKEAKALAGGNAASRDLVRVAIKGISIAIISLLVQHRSNAITCPKCRRGIDEDVILCEGLGSCNRWFHRTCVDLYAGSFSHTGWFCGIAPCKGKQLDEERMETEKKQVREKALQEREEEVRQIKEQKASWEKDQLEKKKREEQEQQEKKMKEERDKQLALERLRNLDKESSKVQQELDEAEKQSLQSTGLSLEQVASLERWNKKSNNEDADESVPPKPPREKSENLTEKVKQDEVVDVPVVTTAAVRDARGRKLLPEELFALVYVSKARALYDYDPVGDEVNALKFHEGDVIDVVQKSKDGWWEGVLNGYYGSFYGTFVEEISTSTTPTAQAVVTSTAIDIGKRKPNEKVHHQVSVPKIAVRDLEDPEYEGFLNKQGGTVKSWKRRWMVLKDFVLYYFEVKDNDAMAIGMIPLPSYSVMPAPEIKKDYAFKLEHPSARSYVMSADSNTDMELWIETLRRAAEVRAWNDSATTSTTSTTATAATTTATAITSQPQDEPPSKPPRGTLSGKVAFENGKLVMDASKIDKASIDLSTTSNDDVVTTLTRKESITIDSSLPARAAPRIIKPSPLSTVTKPEPVASPSIQDSRPEKPPKTFSTAAVLADVASPPLSPSSANNGIAKPPRPTKPLKPLLSPTATEVEDFTTDATLAASPSSPAALPEPPRASFLANLSGAQGDLKGAFAANLANTLAANEKTGLSAPAPPTSSVENTVESEVAPVKSTPPPRPSLPPKALTSLVNKTGSLTSLPSSTSSPSLTSPSLTSLTPSSEAVVEAEDSDDEDEEKTSDVAPTTPAAKSKKSAKLAKAPVPNMIVKQLDNPTLAGWLTKQGGSNRNWKKRWFILKNFAMYYFESSKWDAKALGVIPLPSYSIEEATKPEVNKNFSFKASHPSARTYYFSADNQEQQAKWMEAMRCSSKMVEYSGEKIV